MDSPILSPIFSPLNFKNDDKTNSWIAWMNNADEANRIAKENEDLRSVMADMKRHITLLEQIVLSEDGDGPIHQIHDSLLNSAPGSVEIIEEYPPKQQQYDAPALFEMEIPPPAQELQGFVEQQQPFADPRPFAEQPFEPYPLPRYRHQITNLYQNGYPEQISFISPPEWHYCVVTFH